MVMGAVMGMVRRAAVPLVVAALIVVAALSLNRVYNGLLLVELVAGAALASVVVSAVLRRAPAWLVAPVSVLALVGYSLFAVNASAQAGAVDGDLRTLALDAARNAVPRLLTALIPVEPQPDTVLGPVVLAWLAGFAGAELAARARRPAVALVPPTLLYAGALVLVGPNAPFAAWQPLAFAALAAVGLALGGGVTGGPRQRVALRLRMTGGLALGLVAVLAVVGVVAPLVAAAVGRTPFDPRRYVEPPSLDLLDQNPLLRISGWAADPDRPLLNVTVLRGANRPSPSPSADDAEEEPAAYDTRLRLAVLEDWDGVTWHVDADYRSAGRVLPAVAAPPGLAASEGPPPLQIEERITVDGLQGRLLPAIPAPQRVEGVRVAYDATTGTLLHTAPLTPGLTYTVTSVNASVDVASLPAADVPSGPDLARFLTVGDTVPTDLGTLAEKVAAGEGSPYLRALALESFLSEHYGFSAEAPSGHAYPNLRFFLFADPRAGGQRGTSEQFASAFAALGRLMGLPTRVVVGFRTPAGGGTVTAGDAQAWPEVLFDGVGWVAFDPMPNPDTPPRPLEDEFLPKPTPPTTPPETVDPPEETTATAAPPATSGPVAAAPGPGVGTIAGGVGGGLVVLVVLLLLVIVLLRAYRRRSRLDRGSPPQRVLGAWAEVLEALSLAGRPPPPHLAAAEVAEHAALVATTTVGRHHTHRRPRPAVPPLDDLAARVNAVAFSGGTTGVAGGADDLGAHAAKVKAVEYARALRSRRSLWRRLLWRIDPRPLRRPRP